MVNNYIIELHGVSKKYNVGTEEISALNDVSLQIEHGNFVLVHGPSGCGKTSLLLVIAGILSPSNGKVILDDNDFSKCRKEYVQELRCKMLGLCFQSPNLIPNLSVFENVEVPLSLQDIPYELRKKRVHQIFKDFNLQNLVDKYPYQLSGGELMRVALLRGIVHDPKLLLCDEPFGNLDIDTREQVLSLLLEIKKNREMTFIIASHDIDLKRYSDQSIHLIDGKVKKRLSEGQSSYI